MDTTSSNAMYLTMTKRRSPYDPEPAPRRRSHNPVVRAGMSLAELAVWLVVMAALAVGMIVLLWHVAR